MTKIVLRSINHTQLLDYRNGPLEITDDTDIQSLGTSIRPKKASIVDV